MTDLPLLTVGHSKWMRGLKRALFILEMEPQLASRWSRRSLSLL